MNGTTYELQVRAKNFLGDGEWSLSAEATPFALTGVSFTSPNGPINGSTLSPGTVITVAGDDLPPGADLELVMNSTPVTLDTIVVGPSGDFLLTATIPSDADPGLHTLVLTITGPGITTASTSVSFTLPTLALTGVTGVEQTALRGSLLVFVGALMLALVAVRRREGILSPRGR